MKTDRYFRAVWLLMAVSLLVIALRPYVAPAPVRAQAAPDPTAFYIEPGVHSIRLADGAGEVTGKIVVDLRSGNIWGFPTGMKLPYPVTLRNETPLSHPVYLGKFDFAAMDKRP